MLFYFDVSPPASAIQDSGLGDELFNAPSPMQRLYETEYSVCYDSRNLSFNLCKCSPVCSVTYPLGTSVDFKAQVRQERSWTRVMTSVKSVFSGQTF